MGSKPSHIGWTEKDLETLQNVSNRPREEILEWLENIKTECPSGKLDKEKFIKYFKLFSTEKNIEEIAQHCFNVFDLDKNGYVDLGEFLIVYVILNSTDTEEKLNYVFNMYDQDNNGFIDVQELQIGLKAMFKFLNIDEKEKCIHKIMEYLDENKDGRINKTEFIDGLLSDPYLIKYMSPFY